jgi:hypothetical protein
MAVRQRRNPRQNSHGKTFVFFGIAALVGGIAGVGSIGLPSGEGQSIPQLAMEASIDAGFARRRAPRPGDMWGGCNDARAAGTAPIYRGEPGYREDMDGDNDGVACETHYEM